MRLAPRRRCSPCSRGRACGQVCNRCRRGTDGKSEARYCSRCRSSRGPAGSRRKNSFCNRAGASRPWCQARRTRRLAGTFAQWCLRRARHAASRGWARRWSGGECRPGRRERSPPTQRNSRRTASDRPRKCRTRSTPCGCQTTRGFQRQGSNPRRPLPSGGRPPAKSLLQAGILEWRRAHQNCLASLGLDLCRQRRTTTRL
mmetsp:Transcript_103770/g.292688  ORF Transcript_103770/g.292688 Transcript_103770/m.292688 type:complete len:201 (-) Transcript_103770:177-779(-)